MKRIQRKRTKGWKSPSNTVYVGRPSKWGNPFDHKEYGRELAVKLYRYCLIDNYLTYFYLDEIQSSLEFERFKWMSENIKLLKGKNLSCFCPEGKLCHADVLIEICLKENYGTK